LSVNVESTVEVTSLTHSTSFSCEKLGKLLEVILSFLGLLNSFLTLLNGLSEFLLFDVDRSEVTMVDDLGWACLNCSGVELDRLWEVLSLVEFVTLVLL